MQRVLMVLLGTGLMMFSGSSYQTLIAQEQSADHDLPKTQAPAIVCGDADGSGTIELGDAIFLINYLYGDGPSPNPRQAGDQNCDGVINISDCAYLIAYIFDLGGEAPCCPSEADYCPRIHGNSFDLETAKQMAKLADASYSPTSSLSAGSIVADCWTVLALITSDPDFECDVVVTGQEDTQLFLARDPWTDDIVVSFRGSESLQDWISDAQFANAVDWIMYEGYESSYVVEDAVHKGFYCAYRSIRNELRAKLAEAIASVTDASTARVYFTGHSLGGALATLASLDLTSVLVQDYGYEKDNILMYNFGSPRVFKPVLFWDYFYRGANSYSVIEKTDPVPYLLPTYIHIQNIIEINSRLNAAGTPTKTRLDSFWNSYRPSDLPGEELMVCGPADNTVPWSYGQDGHDGRKYITRLENVVEPGVPSMSLSIKNGCFNFQWSGDVKGPCDKVALVRDLSDVANPLFPLLNWEWALQGTAQQTAIPKSEGYRVAYVNSRGELLGYTGPYVAKTPSKLTIKRMALGFIEITWNASDEGLFDYVAIFNKNPNTAGPLGYLTGTKHLVFNDLDDVWAPIRPGGPYWVAYVTADALVGGNRRILRVAGPIN